MTVPTQILNVLDPELRQLYTVGRDGTRVRAPGRYLRGGLSMTQWHALTRTGRESVLDRIAPMGMDPAELHRRSLAWEHSAAPGWPPLPSSR